MTHVSRSRSRVLIVTVLAPVLGACAAGMAHDPSIRPLAHGPRELASDQQVRHVLNRLAFGARPDDYAAVKRVGVDRWVGEQLAPARIDDHAADSAVAVYTSLSLDQPTLAHMYALPNALRKAGGTMVDTFAVRTAQRASDRIVSDVRGAKLMRATVSRRQLQEVMTDFWENHFSIFADKGADRYMLVGYDRTIRAHALGNFRDLLGAVAHSPAMLYYLDNWQSKADGNRITLAEVEGAARAARARAAYDAERARIKVDPTGHVVANVSSTRPPAPYRRPVRRGLGLNENYGRELLELHTLGVDGGYTQHDVTEAARVLTGWTLRDPNSSGEFLFRPEMHDAAEKVVLGHVFPAGHGEDEGEALLDLLAREPATAHFIALKLCRRFVSDSPPPVLVDRAAASFLASGGDIAETMRVIISSPEFFSQAAYRAKVKSPFELVVSTLRALDTSPDTLQRAVQAVGRLGEPMWGRISPDGFPETGNAWINSGSILNRINFGVQLAAGRQIPGVSVNDWPEYKQLVRASRTVQVNGVILALLGGDASPETRRVLSEGTGPTAILIDAPLRSVSSTQSSIADVVGLALGSPEFQRH